jgi:riboflavin synthase
MFTGIVREMGVVRELRPEGGLVRVRIEAPKACAALRTGASIAVDGICLTATEVGHGMFAADVVPETLSRTRLGDVRAGDRVNLELPVRAGDPLDGHVVQGHVDGTGVVAGVSVEPGQNVVTVRVGQELAPYLAEKGSVAVNGVSLTVTGVTPETFSFALIPTTLRETNLAELTEGSRVNVEVDILARYAARREETAKWRAP